MEGDSFSDPRRRLSRGRGRGRGGGRGRGRGRGRGLGGSRGGGGVRGRGSRPSRGRGSFRSSKVQDLSKLGSNVHRYQGQESSTGDEQKDDPGLDFEQLAESLTPQDLPSVQLDDSNLLSELNADFSGLEKVLSAMPQWTKLGKCTKFALGVPINETENDYLNTFSGES